MSPASAARRSASDMAQATQVAPLPVRRGWRAPASPPPESAGTGFPASSSRKDSGPRLEAMTRSAPPMERPYLRTGAGRVTMGAMADSHRPPLVLAAPDAFKGTAPATA